jgi:hypothetical protein
MAATAILVSVSVWTTWTIIPSINAKATTHMLSRLTFRIMRKNNNFSVDMPDGVFACDRWSLTLTGQTGGQGELA